MILLTELSTREQAPDCISDGQGVWRFSFGGDDTYIDDLGAEFFWGDRREVFNLRGVVRGTTNYTEVASVADCRANEESFYWDNSAKQLFVHHLDDANDYTLARASYRVLTVQAGFSTSTFVGQPSVYSGLYFDPRITSIGNLNKQADPLKFGILSFESSDYELANADGDQDGFSLSDALNSQVRFVLMQAGQTDIDDGVRIFTGYTGGARRSDDSIAVTLQEARTFYNRSACPSVFSSTDYASIDPKFEGKRIPVAYGDVRRGIAVPVDTASFDKATGGDVTFKLADESLGAIGAIDALYDSNGNEVTIKGGSINLVQATCIYTVPAGADIDLSRFSWRGDGYVLASGTDTNGLDIMRDVFDQQAGIAFLSTTFDTTEWNAQTAANTQPVGLSVQSDRGLIEEIIEPITVSLQGVVDILGDGRITFRPRDPDALITRTIYQDELIGEPSIEIQTDEVVSEVVIEYSPSFVDEDDVLRTTFADNRAAVGAAYGIDNAKPVSPVRTLLTTEADALAVGEEVASTSSDPQTIVSLTIALGVDQIQLFEIVQANIGRSGQEDWRVFEVLARGLSYTDGQLLVALLLRELPDRQPDFSTPTAYDEGLYSQSPVSNLNEGLYTDSPAGYLDEGSY